MPQKYHGFYRDARRFMRKNYRIGIGRWDEPGLREAVLCQKAIAACEQSAQEGYMWKSLRKAVKAEKYGLLTG